MVTEQEMPQLPPAAQAAPAASDDTTEEQDQEPVNAELEPSSSTSGPKLKVGILPRSYFGKEQVFDPEDVNLLKSAMAPLISTCVKNPDTIVSVYDIMDQIHKAGPSFQSLLAKYKRTQIYERVRQWVRYARTKAARPTTG